MPATPNVERRARRSRMSCTSARALARERLDVGHDRQPRAAPAVVGREPVVSSSPTRSAGTMNRRRPPSRPRRREHRRRAPRRARRRRSRWRRRRARRPGARAARRANASIVVRVGRSRRASGPSTCSASASRLAKFSRICVGGARLDRADRHDAVVGEPEVDTRKNGIASRMSTALDADRVRQRVPHDPRGLAPARTVPASGFGLKTRPFSTRGPSTARIAGSTTTDATAARPTTATPANANDRRYGIGKSTSAQQRDHHGARAERDGAARGLHRAPDRDELRHAAAASSSR